MNRIVFTDTSDFLAIDNGDIIYDGAAVSLARAALLQKLILDDSREYSIKLTPSEPLPILCKTYSVMAGDEDYTGVLLVRDWALENGIETVDVVMRDLSAPILT